MTREYTHGTKDTVEWFKKAKPEPSSKDLSTQIGVHLEEITEFLDVLNPTGEHMNEVANLLERALVSINDLAEFVKKNGGIEIHSVDRVTALDSLADQVVTAVGVAVYAGMNFSGALNEVNRSNFSKFDNNGNPILDNNRKIIKGPDYSKPDLTPFV